MKCWWVRWECGIVVSLFSYRGNMLLAIPRNPFSWNERALPDWFDYSMDTTRVQVQGVVDVVVCCSCCWIERVVGWEKKRHLSICILLIKSVQSYTLTNISQKWNEFQMRIKHSQMIRFTTRKKINEKMEVI